uniref:Uncharacterized protein n=1 Tax=Amphimedon queenslandica TaxID=400682 RepID=A0A1X7VEN7_AMPQE
MRSSFHPPSRSHVLVAKGLGATMWCWIFWRFKHDWGDVFGHHDSIEPPPLDK